MTEHTETQWLNAQLTECGKDRDAAIQQAQAAHARITALEAERDDLVQAAVAAALREAAEYCRFTSMGLGFRGASAKFAGYVPNQISEEYLQETQSKHEGMAYAEAILALIPEDAQAALDRAKQQSFSAGRKHERELVYAFMQGMDTEGRAYAEQIFAAIAAQETPHD